MVIFIKPLQDKWKFLMFSRYKYETSVSHNKDANSTNSILPCIANHTLTEADEIKDLEAKTGKYQTYSKPS